VKLDRLWHDSRLRRRVALASIGVLLLLVTAATAVFVGVALSSSAKFSDRLAEVGDYIVAGTLLLAVIAGLVALLAYAAATGLPDLQVRLNVSMITSKPEGRVISPFPFIIEIWLRNKSGFSAKNPAVAIRFGAVFALQKDPSSGWTLIDYGLTGTKSLFEKKGNLIITNTVHATQWDGGPAYSIHGYSTRRLPDLMFDGLNQGSEQGSPTITVELLADGGYRRMISFPLPLVDYEDPKRTETTHKELPEWA